ncbi:hypothetical protein D5F01_LYC00693 [Larimichthys crocea]|uniref:Uncharacterized protein n=1 Tax=Larimichthys crocea TaxID=215358 RepID=A0A6G0J9X2_LARCR|nr:hypothetical protein D5F01_LYC00693 [Larimichthys crocea]
MLPSTLPYKLSPGAYKPLQLTNCLSSPESLQQRLSETPQRARLMSQRPFATHAQELLRTTPVDTSKVAWVKARWRDQWKAAVPSRLHQFIEDPTDVPGQDLPRKEWTTLNRLRTGVGRSGAAMQKWGLTDSVHCSCGDPLQTVEHVTTSCPRYRPPNGDRGLIDLDSNTLDWLAAMEGLRTYERRRR